MRRYLSVLVCSLLVVAMAPSSSAAGPEGEFFGKINEERAKAGLSSLSVDSSLLDVARRHSARMAEAGRIFHNDNLPNEVDGWVLLGENVGRGSKTQTIHDAFMASPDHRAQILESRYEGGAVGVVESQGLIWVTELFIKRSGSSPEPASASPIRSTRRAPTKPRQASQATKPAPPPAEPIVEAAVFPERHALVGVALAEEGTIGSMALAIPVVDVDLKSSHAPSLLMILAMTMLMAVVVGHLMRSLVRV